LGQSQVLPYLQGLSRQNFQFTILSFEKRDRFEKEKDIVKSAIRGANIKWVPMRFTSKPPVLSKIYDRWKLKQMALKLYRKQRFDLVHCRSYVAAEIGLNFKKKFNTKFLFDMRGFWADEKVDNGQWDQTLFYYRLIYKYYKKKEENFLLNADSIISLTQSARDFLLSKPEYRHLSIEVIPCCADLDHFDYQKISSEDIHSLKNRLQIPATAKVITYLGSAGGWYLINEMFSFCKMLIDQKPEYVMLVLTKDNIKKVREEALSTGIPNDKIFVTYSNREKLPQFLALSTCGVFFIRNTSSKIASSPSKHAELMGMGIPIICNDIGDTGYIVNKTKTGIIVDDFSEYSFQDAISQIDRLEKIDRRYIQNCSREIFDLNIGVQQYSDIYNRIMN
jgi:glycosyltransferase involved in cell wall biosynthesis